MRHEHRLELGAVPGFGPGEPEHGLRLVDRAVGGGRALSLRTRPP